MKHLRPAGYVPATNTSLRVWGLDAMTLRQSLAAVCLIGIAVISGHGERSLYASGVLLMGLPYFIAGYVSKTNPIGIAEYSLGAYLGALICLIIQQ